MFEEDEEEYWLSDAEQENYFNLQEELRRQIEAVIEENQQLRKGNEELLVALEQLRERKEELLGIYRANIRKAKRLENLLAEKSQSHTTNMNEGRREWDYRRHSRYFKNNNNNPYSSTINFNSRFNSNSFTTSYPQSGLYQRALDYARYSTPDVLSRYSHGSSRRSHLSFNHYY